MNVKCQNLWEKSLQKEFFTLQDINTLLYDESLELLDILNCAYLVRKRYFGKKVKIHIINNIQSGNCTEDCKYCAQSSAAKNNLNGYPMKSDDEILLEAKNAYKNNGYRYCMVFSGPELGEERIEKVIRIVKKIKASYKISVCVSAGFLTKNDALRLKEAGVDRYNHNMNSSKEYYQEICSTHSFSDRIKTINNAKEVNLGLCCGVIIGLGESTGDILSIINQLRAVNVQSIPINFFIPVAGHRIKKLQALTPQYCLRVLALFRLAIPEAEIRVAGGREYHLRSQQSLSLYAADSLFARGYLTSGGDSVDETKQMILDGGFEIDRIEY